MMLDCQEFRYYNSGAGSSSPYGCQCGAWSSMCPFETCSAEHAWEDQCLAPEATALGFTALSKNFHTLPLNSLPAPMKAFKHHPGTMSMCLYWLPKPPNPTLPEMRPLPSVLPKYANLRLEGADVFDCARTLNK